MRVTRRIEFDAGHRIPSHDSKCRHLHGHRYRLEVTVSGEVLPTRGKSDDGMVVDFGAIKELMVKHIHDAWDHKLLLWEYDAAGAAMLPSTSDALGIVRLPVVPTAENLARLAFDVLSPLVDERYSGRLRVAKVRLYETPNCWADHVSHPD